MKMNYAKACSALLFAASINFLAAPVRATSLPLGAAANYAVLFEGNGGHTLHVTNVTINGNVGVGGTGLVSDSGPSTITGTLDFAAGNTGQFSGAPGDIGPISVNYNVTAVTSAITTINALSTTLGSEAGTSITINGNQTINASSGTLDANGDEVFSVTSYHEGDGNILTINGNGDNVVLNLTGSGNPQLGGDVILNGGLTPDQVVWNYTGTNNLSLNNNASSYPLPNAFMGIILAPNAALSLVNANLDGRVFGGDSSDMQVVSGDTITAPSVPEPGTYFLAALGFAGLAALRLRRRRAA
jgi:choice-of-anchor A domain-containing protein